MELTRMTAAELAAALAAGEVSATEVTQAHLARITAVDDRLHAFLHVAAGSALGFAIGAVLFGATVILPQYVQGLLGFTATLSGELIFVRAFFIAAITPFISTPAAR